MRSCSNQHYFSFQIAVHTLYKIFRKFGTIRSISRVDAKSVKICFMSTESMDKLKNIRRMSIGKHRIQIRWLGDSSKQQRSSHKEFSVKTFTVTNVPLKVCQSMYYQLSYSSMLMIFPITGISKQAVQCIESVWPSTRHTQKWHCGDSTIYAVSIHEQITEIPSNRN